MIHRYETLTGRHLDVRGLTGSEKRMLSRLLILYHRRTRWERFSTHWQRLLGDILMPLPPRRRTGHILYRVAQDLEMRLGIAQGMVAPPDYRDYMLDRIEEKYGSRYRFCKATGIPEAFLSQVLAGKKDFSLAKLRDIAETLDLRLALVPASELPKLARA